MALTNETSQSIRDNVVSDGGNITVPGKPKSLSPEAAILLNKSIVARPLMVPEVCSIRVKNTEYRYRWVNALSQNGRYYQQRKAQGFVNATSDDVELLGGDAVADKGEIRAGDLILMKIRSDIYDAAIKYNMVKAATLTRARGMYLEGASSDVMSDEVPKRMSVSNEPFARTGMAQPFIPDNPDKLVEDSISSGRVEQTRATIDELRKEAQSKK